jgi:hypothetical protein
LCATECNRDTCGTRQKWRMILGNLQRGSSLETCSNPAGQYEPNAEHARYALFRVLIEISRDLLVEDLVSFVDIGDWLVAVVLGLSLLFAETGIVS